MNEVLVICSGALIAAGLAMAVLGALRLHVPTTPQVQGQGSLTRAFGRLRGLSRRTWTRLALGCLLGLVAAVLTTWPVMLVLGPLAVLGIPWLLGTPPNRELDLLVALERWTRGLASSVPTGKSVADAVRATRRQAPAVINEAVTTAVLRMDARWSAADALHAMADDLDSPHADACLAALALASQRGGTGATATLHSLAESLNARLRALREIEAERSKPRVVVRQVTVITIVAITAALLFGGTFFEPYSTPMGQLLLTGLLVAFVGSLVMLRQRTMPKRRDRILIRAVER